MKRLLLPLILISVLFHAYSQDEPIDSQKRINLYDIQRNSLFAEYNFVTLSAMYERCLPVVNKAGILVGGGISQGVAFTSATNPLLECAFIFGRSRHFFDCGVIFAPLGKDVSVLNPLAGYRYQSPRGFLLRFDIILTSDQDTDHTGEESRDFFPVPGIGLGYSF